MFDVSQSPDDHKDYVEHVVCVFDFLILLHQIIVVSDNDA